MGTGVAGDLDLDIVDGKEVGEPTRGSRRKTQVLKARGRRKGVRRHTLDAMLEKEFLCEPLISVDLTEVKQQRTREEVRKIMQFLVARKHVLSDGKLDYTREEAPKHNTTCDIKTTELYPRIVSTPSHPR